MRNIFKIILLIVLIIICVIVGMAISNYFFPNQPRQSGMPQNGSFGEMQKQRIMNEALALVKKTQTNSLELEIQIQPLTGQEGVRTIRRQGLISTSTEIIRNIPKDSEILANEIKQAQAKKTEMPKPYTVEKLDLNSIKEGENISITSLENILISEKLTLAEVIVY